MKPEQLLRFIQESFFSWQPAQNYQQDAEEWAVQRFGHLEKELGAALKTAEKFCSEIRAESWTRDEILWKGFVESQSKIQLLEQQMTALQMNSAQIRDMVAQWGPQLEKMGQKVLQLEREIQQIGASWGEISKVSPLADEVAEISLGLENMKMSQNCLAERVGLSLHLATQKSSAPAPTSIFVVPETRERVYLAERGGGIVLPATNPPSWSMSPRKLCKFLGQPLQQ